jgi:hypothetical protein
MAKSTFQFHFKTVFLLRRFQYLKRPLTIYKNRYSWLLCFISNIKFLVKIASVRRYRRDALAERHLVMNWTAGHCMGTILLQTAIFAQIFQH